MGLTWKNGSHSEKRVTLRELVPFIKGLTLVNLGHKWKNKSHYEKWLTFENESDLQKRVTLAKMGHT